MICPDRNCADGLIGPLAEMIESNGSANLPIALFNPTDQEKFP